MWREYSHFQRFVSRQTWNCFCFARFAALPVTPGLWLWRCWDCALFSGCEVERKSRSKILRFHKKAWVMSTKLLPRLCLFSNAFNIDFRCPFWIFLGHLCLVKLPVVWLHQTLSKMDAFASLSKIGFPALYWEMKPKVSCEQSVWLPFVPRLTLKELSDYGVILAHDSSIWSASQNLWVHLLCFIYILCLSTCNQWRLKMFLCHPVSIRRAWQSGVYCCYMLLLWCVRQSLPWWSSMLATVGCTQSSDFTQGSWWWRYVSFHLYHWRSSLPQTCRCSWF